MRQMEVTKKKIGDNTFYIKPFGAFAAARISGEISATIGPVVGVLVPLANMMGNDKSITDLNVEEAVPVITGALASIDGDRVEKLLKVLLIDNRNVSVASAETDGEVELLTYDLANEIFCCGLDDMVRLCIEVARINYGGFFEKVTGQFGSLSEAVSMMEKTQSQNGET